MEVVATICPGNVHTALKRQAPLRLLIPLIQTNSDSKPKKLIIKVNHKLSTIMLEKGDPFSAQQVLVVDGHAL